MKKMIAVLLLLLCLPILAFATEIDLKSMDIDSLLDLQYQISEEIGVRLLEKSEVAYTGIYEVGVSMESGDYILTLTSSREGCAGEVLVFESKRAHNDYHTYLASHEPSLYLDDVQVNTPIHLSLADGEILLIGHGNWAIIKIK